MSEHRNPFVPTSDGWTVGISSRGRHSGAELDESMSDALRPGTGRHRKLTRWYHTYHRM